MLSRLPRVLASVLTLGLVLGACGDDDVAKTESAPFVELNGSPRTPDAEGVVTDVADDFSTLTLDGDRVYEIHKNLQSFAAGDGSIQPVIRWQGQYAQVGLDGDTVEWIGGIAAVVAVPDQPQVVYVPGVITKIDGDRLIFRSGLVLTAGAGIVAPSAPPVAVVATIDVASKLVTALEPG